MRIIVTGGRYYTDQDAVHRELQLAHLELTEDGGPPTLVHGGASGADTLAAEFAATYGWPTEVHHADWKTHGRGAGPIRNQAMADVGADLCVAFPGGRGTADMVRRAKKAGIPVRHIITTP